jgi:riboflavin kinase/FMN adenylyltransferase
MELLRDVEAGRLPPTCVAVGVFDGVHIGHQAVLRQAVAGAREQHLLSAALTFDPHPAQVLQPRRAPPLLTTMPERAALIAETGIDILVIIGFDRSFAGMAPEEFARCVLAERLNARCVVAGEGFVFGRGASGNISILADLGRQLGFHAAAVKRVTVNGGEVSSTVVRELVSRGDMERAAKVMGHHYTITGPVQPGVQRGRSLGFPTANVCVPPEKLLPPDGVYAVIARIDVGRADAPERSIERARGPGQRAVMNIGVPPTFAHSRSRNRPRGGGCVEAHIMGTDPGELYGRTITLDVVSRLREERKFNSSEALVEQIRRDIAQAEEVLRGLA